MNIQIRLTGQTLTATAPNLAELSLGKLFCTLEADSEWDSLSIRLIFQLKSSGAPVTREVQVTDFQSVPVPEACIRAGHLYITAVGIQGDSVRLTTGHMLHGIPISPVMALSASGAETLSPTEYEQLLGLLGPLSQLKTGRKDHLVGAINWLCTNSGGSAAGNTGRYTDVSADFASQPEIPDEITYLRALGDGQWTLDTGYIEDKEIHYFMDIWSVGETEYRLEQKYDDIGNTFSVAFCIGNSKRWEIRQDAACDPQLLLSPQNHTAITSLQLPVPLYEDAGKIPVANYIGGYSLTAVENAEEVPV